MLLYLYYHLTVALKTLVSCLFRLLFLDREFLAEKLYSIEVTNESEESALMKFYELMARPLQGVCR
jgi:hypothetical protein